MVGYPNPSGIIGGNIFDIQRQKGIWRSVGARCFDRFFVSNLPKIETVASVYRAVNRSIAELKCPNSLFTRS